MKIVTKGIYSVVLFLIASIVSFVPMNADELGNIDTKPSQPAEEKKAPDFELKGLDGREYQLKSFVDSLPVLVWFTNLCEGCQANIPTLDSIYLKEIRPGAELLAISLLGDDHKTVEAISSELNYSFPMLFDPEGETCKDYVGTYVPASCPISNLFVIDRQGTIRYETHFPGFELTEVIELLNELSAQKASNTK